MIKDCDLHGALVGVGVRSSRLYLRSHPKLCPEDKVSTRPGCGEPLLVRAELRAKFGLYLRCPVSHIILKVRPQLLEEIQPRPNQTFQLIPKGLTDQLPKRLGAPHVYLHKQGGKSSAMTSS